MLKLSLFLVITVNLLSTTMSQNADSAWCNIQDKGQKDLTYDFKNPTFQATAEKTGGRTVGDGSLEIREYYDGTKNIAIVKQVYSGTTVTSYLYGNTNELLLVTPNSFGANQCVTLPLSEAISETTFFLYNGKIVSGINYFLLIGNKLTYTGTSEVRGIPVNNWQTCYFNVAKNSTELMTISISDGDKWAPAESSNFKSIPVLYSIKTQKNDKFEETTETYTITEFKPYLLLQEEDYFVPESTYCENRKSIMPFPQLPTEMAFYLEGAISGTDKGMSGNLTKTKEYYDFDAKLFKLETFINDTLITKLNDFATGLSYSINEETGECDVSKIDPNGIDAVTGPGGFTNIRNPEKFFDADNVTYQFSGSRRINGVNTVNWIGKQMFKIILECDSLFEWSFLSSYNRTDDVNTYIPTPVRLTITQLLPLGSGLTVPVPFVYNFIDFRVSDSLGAHHDIRQCVDSGRSKTFSVSFEATDEVIVLAKTFPNVFRKAAYRGLYQAAKVAPIRIQDLRVLFNDNHIFFVFEIMQKSKFYGNVMVPFDDVSLQTAEFLLGYNVADSNLKVHFVIGDIYNNEDYLLVANPLSFARIENQDDGFMRVTTIVRPNGYTGVTVAVACTLVVATLLVLVFGLLVLHRNEKINIPCLPN